MIKESIVTLVPGKSLTKEDAAYSGCHCETIHGEVVKAKQSR